MTYTREDIVRIVQEEDVKFIRMQFVDIFGQLKNVAITAGQLEKALDNRIMIDGSSIEGFVRVNESDQYLRTGPGQLCHLSLAAQPRQGGPAALRCVQSGRHTFYRRPPAGIAQGDRQSAEPGPYIKCRAGV